MIRLSSSLNIEYPITSNIMKFSFADSGLALASAFILAPRPLYAQPITYPGYVDPHQEGSNWENGNGRGKLLDPLACEELSQDEWGCGFSKVLAWMRGKPSTREYLAMFSEKYVENNGKFYAVKNSEGNGALTFREDMTNGLYEVLVPGLVNISSDSFSKWLNVFHQTDTSYSCIVFKLLIAADNIGQIIAAPTKYEPIQVVGVDQDTSRIYGYYPINSSEWARKRTVWGDAKDGSMSSTDDEVIGLTTNDRVRVHNIRMLHFLE